MSHGDQAQHRHDYLDIHHGQPLVQAAEQLRQSLGVMQGEPPADAAGRQRPVAPGHDTLEVNHELIEAAERMAEEVIARLSGMRDEVQRTLDEIVSGNTECGADIALQECRDQLSALDGLIRMAQSGSPAAILMAATSSLANTLSNHSDRHSGARQLASRDEMTLTSEKFSEAYQEHRAQLDQFWREWDAAEVKLSHEISSMARDFNDKYDLGIDVEGYEAQREDLLRQIEAEDDPLEKARLRRELAEVNYDIANETVESLEARMARGEYVDPADYERAVQAREEAAEQREEAAKGLLEEERSKEMQAIERRRTELELRIANLEAAYANGDVSAEDYHRQQARLRAETAVVDAEEAVVQEQLAQRKGQVEQANAVQGELDQGFSTVTEAESRNAEEMGDGELLEVADEPEAYESRQNALLAGQGGVVPSERDDTPSRPATFQTAAIAGLGDTTHTAPEPEPAFDSVTIAGLGEDSNGPTAEEPAAPAFESADIAGLNEVEDNPPGPTPQAEPAKGKEKGKASPTARS